MQREALQGADAGGRSTKRPPRAPHTPCLWGLRGGRQGSPAAGGDVSEQCRWCWIRGVRGHPSELRTAAHGSSQRQPPLPACSKDGVVGG